jgi:alkylhydroperoxidase family enzyme
MTQAETETHMSNFTIHTIESAPEDSKAQLEEGFKAFGMIPNLHGTLAESPELYKAYSTLHSLFMETSFDKDQLTVVWQTINVEHECHYCVPAHTMIANSMKVDPAITEALRNETPLASEKLEALRTVTLQLVRKRGQLTQSEVETFFNAGYAQKQLLEIIVGISQKVISNYVNYLAETPLDKPFKSLVWEKKS